MFFRNKQGNNSNSYNGQTIHHTEDDGVTHETCINNVERPFQLIKPILTFFTTLVVLHQLWSNYDVFMSYIFRLRSVILPLVATVDENVPIFGPLNFDAEASNPVDPIRLTVVILFCFVMTIPFLI